LYLGTNNRTTVAFSLTGFHRLLVVTALTTQFNYTRLIARLIITNVNKTQPSIMVERKMSAFPVHYKHIGYHHSSMN